MPWWKQRSHKVILIKRDSCRVIIFPSCHPSSMSPLGGSKPGTAATPAEEQVCEWWQRGGNCDCGLKLRPLMYVKYGPRGAITWLL